MSNPTVLTVSKAAITRALGGTQVHGIHQLDNNVAGMVIESNLLYREHDEKQHDVLAVLPFISFPRTITDNRTGRLATFFATYRHNGKVHVGFGDYLGLQDAVHGDEIEPETQEPILSFLPTVHKGLQRQVSELVGIRIIMEGTDKDMLKVHGTGMALIDHSSDEGRSRVGLFFLGTTPMNTDVHSAIEGSEDMSYITVAELMEKHGNELHPWSKAIVEATLQREVEYNAQRPE